MRNFYLALFLFVFSIKTQAYTIQKDTVLNGAKAYEYLKGAITVRLYDNITIPAFIKFDEGTNYTKEELTEFMKKWGGWDERFSLKKVGTETDELGLTHERYQQMYLNYPVFGGNYIFHLKNGNVVSMNGLLFSAFQVNTLDVTENDAFAKAKSYMNATSFKWELPGEEAHLKVEQGDSSATFYPKTERVIIPAAGDFYKKNNEFRLCYAFDLYAHEPVDRKKVYVDGVTNDVNFHEQLLQHANTTGVATTAYSGVRNIQTDSTAPTNFRLRETTRGLGCETWNLQKGTNYGAAVDFLDTDNNWNNVNANLDQYATDGHWGLEMTYDYFWLKHNRNSINNAGFKLLNYVHYSTNYTNAFWDGSRMTYGDGAAPYTPLVAMDIVAHELTHGLTSNTSNLVYSNESGALNESFSDIFGVAVDFYSRPTLANYLMGDGIGGTPFRSMSNPNTYGDPDTYLGTNWYAGTADNGGVHTNSGVQNFWFYLMVNGGSGTNDLGNAYSVAPLGLDTAGKIAFRNNTVYLFTAAQYADARFYAIQSAVDLYGICSEPVKRTTNAWHAVGVGSKWDTTMPVSFTANPVSNCLVPSSHTFINASNNAAYQWYFGDGGTSTAVNPVYVYNAFGSYTVKLVATCGIKKDSLIRTNYINLAGVTPVNFVHTPDTIVCENSPLSLYANSNLGAPTWVVNGQTDSILNITPIASGTYYFTRNNSCQTFRDSIKVTVQKRPVINTATVSFPTVCAGNIDTVKATGSLRNDVVVQLGTATTTTTTNGNTPYNRTWEGNRSQWIVRASELTALGVTAGPIKSLQFNVTAAGSGTNNQKNFTIKIGHTPQDTMTLTWATITGGFTQVYGPTNIPNPTVGWNNYTFNAPFYWNGTSNIIIEVCHDNDINNTCASCYSPNPTIQYSTLTYRTVFSNYSDNAIRCGTAGGTNNGYTVTRRPNMRFGTFPIQSNTAGINWNWTPGNLTTANAVVFPTNIPTSTYKVVATTPATTCKDSNTVNINVVAKPTLVARTDTSICNGSSVNLTATASGTVTWNPGALVGSSVSVSPTTTTQYIASVNNGTCTVFDTVLITVVPVPTLTARNDTSLCAGQSVNLTAVSNISPITWNPGGLIGSPVSVTPASTTSYVASVNNMCRTKLDTVNITIIPIPVITARADTSFCAGASLNLTATSNISPITWTPGALVASPVLVTPASTTPYIAQVSNACGIKRDTVNVTVIPIPTLVARNDTSICKGASVNLTATSNISPITWNPGALVGSSVSVTPNVTIDYIATVNNACGSKNDTVKNYSDSYSNHNSQNRYGGMFRFNG